MSTTRVLHLISHLGYGGTERQLFLLIKHLRDVQHDVAVFNDSSHTVYDAPLRALAAEIFRVPRGSFLARTVFLTRLCRQLRPDIVHSWSVHDNAYAAVAGRLARVPRRWGSLRGTSHSPSFRRLPVPLRRLCLRGVDRLVVNSGALRSELVEQGLGDERISVIYNAVESNGDAATSSAGVREQLGLTVSAPLIGMVANLRRVKNHGVFLRAVARLRPRFPDLHAIVVGQPLASEPDYPESLRAEAKELGIESHVSFLGFRADVKKLLEEIDIVCLTSDSEGMPNALLEAMAAARPVVATRVGGAVELVEPGKAGLLVPPGDANGLAGAVGQLLADPALARQMGQNGRNLVTSRYSCLRMADAFARLYGASRPSEVTAASPSVVTT